MKDIGDANLKSTHPTSSAQNENLRPLLNRNIPLISGKYGLRNHFWPLESVFSHEQKWEKVRKRGLKQWNPSCAILYVNTISKQLSDRIFIKKWPRNKLLSFVKRLDSPCTYSQVLWNGSMAVQLNEYNWEPTNARWNHCPLSFSHSAMKVKNGSSVGCLPTRSVQL